MKRKAVKIRKYALGGELEGFDSLAFQEGLDSSDSTLTGGKEPKKATTPTPTPQQTLRNKYKSNPYLVGSSNRYFWATQTNRDFPLSGGNVGQAVKDAATFNKVDPALLYASAMEEGMSGAIDTKNWENASEAYVQWSEKNPKLAEQFPVDSFYNYGLDQFAGQIPGLVKKGYLPAGFEKNVQSFDAYNEKDEKIKAAAFNTDANALMAKSAMMRLAQDQLDAYSKSRGYNLTPEQKEFFLLANYNGGQGNMQKMLDSYSTQGYLKNNDFLNTNFTPSNYAGIYKNVQARIQAARMLRDEHIFKYGGKMPKAPKEIRKYPEGGEIPLTGDEPPKFSDQENYYRASARLSHYKGILNEKLKAKNPEAFNTFFQSLSPLRRSGKTEEANKFVQNSTWNDYLSSDEVKKSLGDDYQDYLDSIKAVNAYDVAQGRQPLYGTKETGTDLNNLNYGRRFASLMLTPSFSSFNQTRGTSYSRSYTYDPTKRIVSYNETGDVSQRPSFLSTMKMGGKIPKYPNGGLVDPVKPKPKGKVDEGFPMSTINSSGEEIVIYPNGTTTKLGTPPPIQSIDEGFPMPITSTSGDETIVYPNGTTSKISAPFPMGVSSIDEGFVMPFSAGGDQGLIYPNGTSSKISSPFPMPTYKIDEGFVMPGQIDPKTGRKYAFGTEDPIKGVNQDTGIRNAPGFNPFGSFPSTSLTPQAPLNEQIYNLDPNQTTIDQQGRVVPVEAFDNGAYVNPDGQMQVTAEQQAIANQRSMQNAQRAQRSMENRDDAELVAGLGITAINAFFNKRNQAQQNRSGRRNAMMQMINNQIFNPYAEGTGSQAIMEKGGKLSKRFEEDIDTGVQTLGGGKTKTISTSDHSNSMIEFTGKEHKEGGIGIQYGGSIAEVEDKEVGWIDDEGNLNIFGKMKLPGTSTTFRTAAKNLAEQESKVDKQKHKYLSILNNSNAADPYQESARSTAKVMTKSLDKQSLEIAEKKEAMASYQSLVLAMTQIDDQKMAYGGTMPKRPKLQEGAVLSGDPIKDIAKAIGQFESGASYTAVGVPVTKGQYKGQRALGKYQIMEDNVRTWGKAATGKDITVAEFIANPALQDQIAEYQIRQIAKTHPNPADIASIWFTGRPTSNKSAGTSTDDLGTSGNQYVKAVMNIYNGISGGTNNIPNANTPRSSTPVPNILNYTPKKRYSPTDGGEVLDTRYGSARKQPSVFKDETRVDNTQPQRDYQSPLAFEQIAPELLSIATNRRDPVNQLSYQPELKQTFDVSYQLGRNENQSTFNQAARVAEQSGNIGALSEMAAQKYKADQTYNMQEVQGNAQQRLQTYNQNIDVLNDAQVKNLALIADQQVKQAQATFNTRAEDLSAFRSIAGKVQQNRLENVTYNAYANLFKHYGFDKKGNVTFNPDNISRRFTPGEAQQFGMVAAQQGAQAIMNGDFSRQFTKVKNTDGSQTTTETLGTNKKIQEEYKTLKNQGFDDSLIGNILRAKYPETISE